MIPKIIHQTWKSQDIPKHLRGYQESWLRNHPGWEYRLWDDAANETLIAEHYPEFLDYYQRATPRILGIDMVRLAYLHRYGGIYADLDYEILRPLDDLLNTTQAIVGRERGGIGLMLRKSDYIINALMASPPGHPLWPDVMRAMVQHYRPQRMFERHTVYVIRMAVEILDHCVENRTQTSSDVIILPPDTLYASAPTERLGHRRNRHAIAQGSYGIHHYDNSWRSPLARMANQGRVFLQRLFP